MENLFAKKNNLTTVSKKTKRYVISGGMILYQIILTAAAVYLSLSESFPVWLAGQLILGFSFLQWFFLEHELGHSVFIPIRSLSVTLGHFSSIFTLIPFHPWQRVHHAHHKWTGWREKDPTIPEKSADELTGFQKSFIDICWKFWIPFIALTFVITTFWNLKRLNDYFPDVKSRRRHLFSIIFLIMVYPALFILFGWLFIKVWAFAFIIYLFISDPYLLSQHTHLDYKDVHAEPIKPVRFIEQDQYCRTIRFPAWIEKYIFYNSNFHGLHHQYPWLPSYELITDKQIEPHIVNWFDWLRAAKKIPGHILIYQSEKDTGFKL